MWIKMTDVANLVKVAPSTVRRWCNRENAPLPHKREGSIIRINETDFWEWWQQDYRKMRIEKIVDFKVG